MRIVKTFGDRDATCIVRIVGVVPAGRYHGLGDEFPRKARQLRRAEAVACHGDGLVALG